MNKTLILTLLGMTVGTAVGLLIIVPSITHRKVSEMPKIENAEGAPEEHMIPSNPEPRPESRVYMDSSGHYREASENAVPKDSLIELGQIKKPLYAESDGEFYGQSGRQIKDTCTDKDMRTFMKSHADTILKEHNVTGPYKYYIMDASDDLTLIELINGYGLFWYFKSTDTFGIADDVYQAYTYLTNNITVEEDDYITRCSYLFPVNEDGYFYGTVSKDGDLFTITNTETNESMQMTLEEMKINAEYGPQFED